MKGLSANIEVIENSKGSDKRVLKAEKFKYIQNLTKDLDIIKYFYSMEIYGFYIIEIDVKKNNQTPESFLSKIGNDVIISSSLLDNKKV